jgi:potassium channel subfamily K
MASAFSICALIVHWRVYIPPGEAEQNGVPLPDPKWYVIDVDVLSLGNTP